MPSIGIVFKLKQSELAVLEAWSVAEGVGKFQLLEQLVKRAIQKRIADQVRERTKKKPA